MTSHVSRVGIGLLMQRIRRSKDLRGILRTAEHMIFPMAIEAMIIRSGSLGLMILGSSYLGPNHWPRCTGANLSFDMTVNGQIDKKQQNVK